MTRFDSDTDNGTLALYVVGSDTRTGLHTIAIEVTDDDLTRATVVFDGTRIMGIVQNLMNLAIDGPPDD